MSLVPLNAFLPYFPIRVSVAHKYDKGWLKQIKACLLLGHR